MSCHTAAAGRVLGFRAEQLDRPRLTGKTTTNQLQVFASLGLFDRPPARRPFPDWHDESAGLDARVRAYLDVNCAVCHQPGAPGNASMDMRYHAPLGSWTAAPGHGTLAGPWPGTARAALSAPNPSRISSHPFRLPVLESMVGT